MNVAYVTAESCGQGHAARGIALVQAGRRAGIQVRAFGPGLEPPDELPGFHPDLILGDVLWQPLTAVLEDLSVPGWALMRWMPDGWLHGADRWERRISIEPAADVIPGITDHIAPIVDTEAAFRPKDGQELRAGYSTWWESVWFGYRDRVRWYTEGSPERQARIDAGGEMTRNGADELMAMIR